MHRLVPFRLGRSLEFPVASGLNDAVYIAAKNAISAKGGSGVLTVEGVEAQPRKENVRLQVSRLLDPKISSLHSQRFKKKICRLMFGAS